MNFIELFFGFFSGAFLVFLCALLAWPDPPSLTKDMLCLNAHSTTIVFAAIDHAGAMRPYSQIVNICDKVSK